MIEIERKFLVTSKAFIEESFTSFRIIQGFLNTDKERTVRVRLKDQVGFLTVKGQSTNDGLTRFEWETSISKSEAEALLKICEKGIIDKIRYEVKSGSHVVEIDVFFGENEGLIVAEVELENEDEILVKPSWFGKEVTGDIKYYNSQLSKQPYKTWD
ncbi:adenylate cyclase [Flavobacteriales bacterium 34_180_T64]|nr:adenylate cyclase [Flavobacteriales bacterium 34_180_T64]